MGSTLLKGLEVTPDEYTTFREWTEKIIREKGEAYIREGMGLLREQAEFILGMGLEPREHPVDTAAKQYFGHPRNKSLAAYKDWILEIVKKMGGDAKDDMTPEQWERDWRLFWSKGEK